MPGVHENSLVQFREVSKRYGKLLALDRVSFDIREGEVFGYIGPNGAGKTTTIKILVGLLTQFQGNLRVAGLRMPDERDQAHQLLGYLPQVVGFQEWRTVDHALRTFGQLSGLSKVNLERRISEVLELLGLSRVRNSRVAHLSGGMVQKLGLAQALLHEPRLLILDEPLAGLDPASRLQIKTTIRALSEQGTTVFFSSHILSDVQDVASRLGILDRGRLVQVGTLEELKAHLGSPKALKVTLSRDSGRWSELQQIPGVERIEQPDPNQLIVYLTQEGDVEAITQRLIVGLIERECYIHSLNPMTPNLDELYLQYVSGGEGE
jgi:ABC-2 type transport system ATP-binding protein